MTAPRGPIKKLDLLPYPDYAGFDYEHYLSW